MLNNQPMGFYSPAVLIKDAQRHGLRVLPVDVAESDWDCTVEARRGLPLRLGLRYARGLREEAGRATVRARPFSSIDDLALRVPELRKDEINRLAEIGALNSIGRAAYGVHRRDALWQAQRATLPVGPLLEMQEETGESPLAPMDTEERLWADYRGTGLTIGRHPMAHRRAKMNALGVTRAAELARMPNGRLVRIAGCVIVRQRPGTAKGVIFMTLEDETDIANIIVWRKIFAKNRRTVMSARFLAVRGRLQRAGLVVHVVAESFVDLSAELSALRDGDLFSSDFSGSLHPEGASLPVKSRDFH